MEEKFVYIYTSKTVVFFILKVKIMKANFFTLLIVAVSTVACRFQSQYQSILKQPLTLK
jgi:hypothetical protein